eukprot:9165101-Lingulodinium_polyedra.AAC.1
MFWTSCGGRDEVLRAGARQLRALRLGTTEWKVVAADRIFDQVHHLQEVGRAGAESARAKRAGGGGHEQVAMIPSGMACFAPDQGDAQ